MFFKPLSIKYSYFLVVACLFVFRASRFIVLMSQTAELFVLEVLFYSSFIMVFLGRKLTSSIDIF